MSRPPDPGGGSVASSSSSSSSAPTTIPLLSSSLTHTAAEIQISNGNSTNNTMHATHTHDACTHAHTNTSHTHTTHTPITISSTSTAPVTAAAAMATAPSSLHCIPCNIVCNGAADLARHVQGIKHRKRVAALTLALTASPSPSAISTSAPFAAFSSSSSSSSSSSMNTWPLLNRHPFQTTTDELTLSYGDIQMKTTTTSTQNKQAIGPEVVTAQTAAAAGVAAITLSDDVSFTASAHPLTIASPSSSSSSSPSLPVFGPSPRPGPYIPTRICRYCCEHIALTLFSGRQIRRGDYSCCTPCVTEVRYAGWTTTKESIINRERTELTGDFNNEYSSINRVLRRNPFLTPQLLAHYATLTSNPWKHTRWDPDILARGDYSSDEHTDSDPYDSDHETFVGEDGDVYQRRIAKQRR